MEKCIIWGAGGTGQDIFNEINGNKYNVVAFVDNNPEKWGTVVKGVTVYAPNQLERLNFDAVVVCVIDEPSALVAQLNSLGVSSSIIDLSYAERYHRVRIQWLKNIAELLQSENGEVAEAGVYKGDFAKHINRFFSEKKLYLFDTFEGFATKDLNADTVSEKAGHFGDTTVQEVLDKMPFPEKCVVVKGHFPESAENVQDSFCFVNLDMDLYLPTLEGLRFFMPRMTKNGVVLVHDYYHASYGPSVRRAIQTFCSEQQGIRDYSLFPIGDSISIAVIGR